MNTENTSPGSTSCPERHKDLTKKSLLELNEDLSRARAEHENEIGKLKSASVQYFNQHHKVNSYESWIKLLQQEIRSRQ